MEERKYTVSTGYGMSWNNQYNCYDQHYSNENHTYFDDYEAAQKYFDILVDHFKGEPGIIVELDMWVDCFRDWDIIDIYETDPEGRELK